MLDEKIEARSKREDVGESMDSVRERGSGGERGDDMGSENVEELAVLSGESTERKLDAVNGGVLCEWGECV